VLWAYRLSVLKEDQAAIALEWLETIDATLSGRVIPKDDLEHPILVLREDKTIAWEEDPLWDSLLPLEDAYKLEH
jgi:nitrogen fixation protein